MIKACIFDLDGTLAYTLDSMATVGNQVVRKFGLNPMPVENYRYYCGNGADMLVKRLLIDAGDKELVHYEEARKLYRTEFDKDPFYKIQHYPGMPETLKTLKQNGVKLGVCSNKPHEAAVKVVKRMFGDQVFDMVMGQSDSIRKKPAPDGPSEDCRGIWRAARGVHVSGRFRNGYADRQGSRHVYCRCSVGLPGKRRAFKERRRCPGGISGRHPGSL